MSKIVYFLLIFIFSINACYASKIPLYIALGDDDNSLLLKKELDRDWTKTAIKTAKNEKLKELIEVSQDIHNHFDIKYLEQRDTNLSSLNLPAIKIKQYGEWRFFDRRTFLMTSYPLLTTKYIIDLHYEDVWREKLELRKEQLYEEYCKYFKSREKYWASQIDKVEGFVKNSNYVFNYKPTSVWVFDEYKWVCLKEAPFGAYLTDKEMSQTINTRHYIEQVCDLNECPISIQYGYAYDSKLYISYDKEFNEKLDGKINKKTVKDYASITRYLYLSDNAKTLTKYMPFYIPQTLHPQPPWNPQYEIVPKDRIEPKEEPAPPPPIKGYTKDNIQIVHKIINGMKSKLLDSEFIEWCNKVTNPNIEQEYNLDNEYF